jgi:hypothetical protein
VYGLVIGVHKAHAEPTVTSQQWVVSLRLRTIALVWSKSEQMLHVDHIRYLTEHVATLARDTSPRCQILDLKIPHLLLSDIQVSIMYRADFIVQGVYNETSGFWRCFLKKPNVF